MTLPQPIQSEIDPLAGCTMPAEEQDLSMCERKSQFSTNLVDPSAVLPEHTVEIVVLDPKIFLHVKFGHLNVF